MNKYDKILDEYREADYGVIPQYDADPVAPKAESTWVLHTQTGTPGSGGGVVKAFMGLGLPYLSADTGGTLTHDYQLSYKTAQGTIKRTTLT